MKPTHSGLLMRAACADMWKAAGCDDVGCMLLHERVCPALHNCARVTIDSVFRFQMFEAIFKMTMRTSNAVMGMTNEANTRLDVTTERLSALAGERPYVHLIDVTRHTSHVTRHTSHVTRRTSHVTHHTSHVTRHTSHVTRRTSHVARHTSHVTRRTSHVARHTSHITRRTSHVTRHTSHVTR
jgi:hypothetical protein